MVWTTKSTTNNQIVLLGIFFLCFITKVSFADNSDIGLIDLNKALILHPKMSFFDYSRLGFYKNKIDHNLIKNTSIQQDNDLKVNIETIKRKIRDLKIKLSEIPTDSNNQYFKDEIINLQNKIERLETKLSDFEFNVANSDITTISETKEILAEISKEVIETINEIAEEHQLSIVINNSEISQNTFPISYNNRSAFKSGIIIGFGNPYYLFLSEAVNSTKTGNIPSSVNLSNWLEYARDPSVVNNLPLKSQSIAIKGGRDILSEVLKKIYLKNNISLKDYQKVEMALIEINISKLLK